MNMHAYTYPVSTHTYTYGHTASFDHGAGAEIGGEACTCRGVPTFHNNTMNALLCREASDS